MRCEGSSVASRCGRNAQNSLSGIESRILFSTRLFVASVRSSGGKNCTVCCATISLVLLDSQQAPKVCGAFNLDWRIKARSAHRLPGDFRDNLLCALIKNEVLGRLRRCQLRYSPFSDVHLADCFDPHEAPVPLPLQYVQVGCPHSPRSLSDWEPR